jgi:hypothetical protein
MVVSKDFYYFMKGLLGVDVPNGESFAHVQALLMALYLRCTPDPKRCWNVLGMAYRMAGGLGLHLSNQLNDGQGHEVAYLVSLSTRQIKLSRI